MVPACQIRGLLKKESLKAGQGGRIDILLPGPGGKVAPADQPTQGPGVGQAGVQGGRVKTQNPPDLRLTYASILLMAHESPGYVQRQMGHSSISIPMDIYCHWIPGEGRKNLENALLEGG